MALDAAGGLSGAAPADAIMLLIEEHKATIRRRLQGDSAFDRPVGELPLGRAALAAVLRRDPPTPLQIERAIDIIEDAVMPLHALAAGAHTLLVRDDALHALARQADAGARTGARAHAAPLELPAVERLFNRLADRAAGRPASQDGLPTDAASSAALLLVRELMHHWGLARLQVLPAAGAPLSPARGTGPAAA